ncbi:MAG: helix-turn-helix transcriptional regulator [Bacillota bacterium]
MRKNNRLGELREAINLTQKELAELVGVTENYIYMLERGLRTPSMKIAKVISELLKKPIEYIFFAHAVNGALTKDSA